MPTFLQNQLFCVFTHGAWTTSCFAFQHARPFAFFLVKDHFKRVSYWFHFISRIYWTVFLLIFFCFFFCSICVPSFLLLIEYKQIYRFDILFRHFEAKWVFNYFCVFFFWWTSTSFDKIVGCLQHFHTSYRLITMYFVFNFFFRPELVQKSVNFTWSKCPFIIISKTYKKILLKFEFNGHRNRFICMLLNPISLWFVKNKCETNVTITKD